MNKKRNKNKRKRWLTDTKLTHTKEKEFFLIEISIILVRKNT